MPSFEEWVKRYEEKTGDEHTAPLGAQTVYDSEKGYGQFLLSRDRSLLTIE